MRALVTGGAGFIGSHLSELLLDEGWEVFALDDLSTGDEANIFHLREREGFHLVVDSVLSQSVVSELVHRCDVVYHLAAAVGVRLIVEQPGRTLLTNVQGAENVLEYCARFEKPVLIASSSEVYGNHPEDVLARGERAADLRADDREALGLRRHEGARRVPRAGASPRARPALRDRAPLQHRRATAEQPLRERRSRASCRARCPESRSRSTATARQTRCFCHVSDVVRALKGLLELADGEIYNVGSTERITIRALAERVLEVTGSGSELVFVPYDEVFEGGVTEEMFHRAPAIGKIEQAIGWEPSCGLDQILADVIESVRMAPAG